MTTKTLAKSENYDLFDDIADNLLPLIRQFALTHCTRAEIRGDKESKKQLDRIQKRLVKLIQDCQPGPLMEADDV